MDLVNKNKPTLTDRDMAIKLSNHLSELLRDGFEVWYVAYDDKLIQIERVEYQDDWEYIMIYPFQEYFDGGYGEIGLSYHGGHCLTIRFPAQD